MRNKKNHPFKPTCGLFPAGNYALRPFRLMVDRLLIEGNVLHTPFGSCASPRSTRNQEPNNCRAKPKGFTRVLATLLLFASAAPTLAQTTFSEKLVTRFSSRWSEIQSELFTIEKELETLPEIPLGDMEGTGGLISYTWDKDNELNLFVHWNQPANIDLVALVPARRFNADGLDPEFGLPDFIKIELLGENDNPVCLVAQETAASARPIKRGFPFVYPLPEPVQAYGARIRCSGFKSHEFPAGQLHTLALAELFCFSGQHNVAERATVDAVEDITMQGHWFWRSSFLVDGLTPLGLPEIPAPNLQHIGWLSEAHASENSDATIDIKFDHPVKLDGIRMFPARRVTSEDPPGFALPQRFRLVAFNQGFDQPSTLLFDHSKSDLMNPGHNPATFRFPETTVQYVRLKCSKMWKNFPNYPAFLAFSEIQLLQGEINLAEGATVGSSEEIGVVKAHDSLVWSEESLTNGYGPQGKLVPRREWMLLLNQRLELEIRKQALLIESENIGMTLRIQLFRAFGGIGALAILALFILPVRYRLRERRQLNKMRLRIASDLHDEVGSNLGSIQILADLSHRKWSEAEEMSTISQIAAETVTAVRDIVWLLRPRTIEQVSIVDHLRESAAIMLEPVEWCFDAGGLDRSLLLNDEDRSNALLFYREALHNLIRHAGASKVTITLRKRENILTLEIADNGCGIEPDKLKKDTTLRALKQRTERLRGKLEIFSNPGEGTLLTLHIPLNPKYTIPKR